MADPAEPARSGDFPIELEDARHREEIAAGGAQILPALELDQPVHDLMPLRARWIKHELRYPGLAQSVMLPMQLPAHARGRAAFRSKLMPSRQVDGVAAGPVGAACKIGERIV